MSGFSGPLFLTTDNFHAESFLVGLIVGRIWNEYSKAYTNNKRRANLSLGDFFFRLSEAWSKAHSNEDAVIIASRTRFKLIDLRTAKVELDLIKIEEEYGNFLPTIQRILRRDNLSPGAKRLALAKCLPKVEHSQIVKWEQEARTPAEIACELVAGRHGYRPSTLRRLLSQAKKFNVGAMRRGWWLQQFNNASDPFPLADIQRLTSFFKNNLLPLIPAVTGISSDPSIQSPDPSLIPSAFFSAK